MFCVELIHALHFIPHSYDHSDQDLKIFSPAALGYPVEQVVLEKSS